MNIMNLNLKMEDNMSENLENKSIQNAKNLINDLHNQNPDELLDLIMVIGKSENDSIHLENLAYSLFKELVSNIGFFETIASILNYNHK